MSPADLGSRSVAARIARSTILLTFRRGILMMAAATSTLVVARWLTPSEYGQLQSALATWTLFLTFADFGVSLSLARDIAADPRNSGSRLRATYKVQSVLCVVLSLVLVTLGLVAGLGTDRGLCLVVLAPSIALSAFSSGRSYFNAVFDVGRVVRVDLVLAVVQTVATVTLIAGGRGPVAAALVTSLCTAAGAVWVGELARRDTPAGGLRVSAMDVVRPAIPLGVVSVLSRVYITADLVIVGYLLSGPTVGAYAGASKLLALFNTLPGLLMSAALPGFTASMASPDAMRSIVTRISQWGFATMIPVYGMAVLYAGSIVRIALGPGYEQAAALLRILCLAGIAGLFAQVFGTLLIAYRATRSMLWQNGVAAIVNVGGNLALVPMIGVRASAWTTVATEVFIALASGITLRRRSDTVHIPYGRVMTRPALTLVPAAIALALWGDHVPALLAAGLSVVAMYAVLGAWPDDLVPPKWRGTRWTAGVS